MKPREFKAKTKLAAVAAVLAFVFFFTPVPATFALSSSKSAPAAKSAEAQVPDKPKLRSKDQDRLLSIVSARADILNSRWQALAYRLDRISERVSSLLFNLNKEGVDTTTAETLLETANVRIGTARERSVEAYTKIISRAKNSNGTASDLRTIEKNFINPEKDAVAQSFQEVKDALNNVLTALPRQ